MFYSTKPDMELDKYPRLKLMGDQVANKQGK